MTATPTDASPKFTPGPWTCFYKHKYDEWHVSLPMTGGNMKLALCPDGIQSGNREADAHLIAAAPDLFHALKTFVEEYVRLIESGDAGFWNPEEEAKVIAARAAISKANPNSARGS